MSCRLLEGETKYLRRIEKYICYESAKPWYQYQYRRWCWGMTKSVQKCQCIVGVQVGVKWSQATDLCARSLYSIAVSISMGPFVRD